MLMKVPDPKTDEVGMKTVPQGDRDIRIFAGIFNAEFVFFAVCSTFFSNWVIAEYISMIMDQVPHLFLSENRIKGYGIVW